MANNKVNNSNKSNNTMYIITNSFNWADEIDFDGFVILNRDDLRKLKSKVQSLIDSGEDEEIEICVGSNEDIDSSYEEILALLDSAKRISEDDVKVFKKHLGLTKSYTDYIEYEYGSNILVNFIGQYDIYKEE